MGISGFFQYIKGTYPDACKRKWNINYDILYIDLNHVLHHVCYISEDTDELLQKAMEHLRKIIRDVKPKKKVVIVGDSVAPLAKMLLQRKRRICTIYKSENLSLQLSSGTKFMTGLDTSLESFVEYIKKENKIDVQLLINDIGEGEIKIKYQIKKNQKQNKTDTHIVFSGDSDMILLLFSCDDLTKIYQIISRDTIINFGKLYDKHIDIFGSTKTTKNDFVFLNLLAGNDYLPKITNSNIENIWKVYGKISKFYEDGLVSCNDMGNDITINTFFFHDILHLYSKEIKPHLLKDITFTEFNDVMYEDYIKGLYWCFNMYINGVCLDYCYLFDHVSKPQLLGVMFNMMLLNKHTVKKTQSIDIDLYGILLIPCPTNDLLNKEQKLIAEKLANMYPIIYEESKCVKCREIHDEIDTIKNNTDYNEQEMLDYLKDIYDEQKIHKRTHNILTFDKIYQISKSFSEIRDELRETHSLDSDNENINTIAKQVVFKTNTQKIIKKMFKTKT